MGTFPIKDLLFLLNSIYYRTFAYNSHVAYLWGVAAVFLQRKSNRSFLYLLFMERLFLTRVGLNF